MGEFEEEPKFEPVDEEGKKLEEEKKLYKNVDVNKPMEIKGKKVTNLGEFAAAKEEEIKKNPEYKQAA